MTSSTFTKIDALRMQLNPDNQTKLESIIEMAEELIDGKQSKWAKRHQFHMLK